MCAMQCTSFTLFVVYSVFSIGVLPPLCFVVWREGELGLLLFLGKATWDLRTIPWGNSTKVKSSRWAVVLTQAGSCWWWRPDDATGGNINSNEHLNWPKTANDCCHSVRLGGIFGWVPPLANQWLSVQCILMDQTHSLQAFGGTCLSSLLLLLPLQCIYVLHSATHRQTSSPQCKYSWERKCVFQDGSRIVFTRGFVQLDELLLPRKGASTLDNVNCFAKEDDRFFRLSSSCCTRV